MCKQSLSTTKKQKKPSRSNDNFSAQKSSARRRGGNSDTNTAPRVNDEWDLNRNSMTNEKLGNSHAPLNNKAAFKGDKNLFDLDKIVQGLATAAPANSKGNSDPQDNSISAESKPYTPLPSPISSQRIRRSQRTLGNHLNKQSAQGPRYPRRQPSDPESLSDGPRRPLRRGSMELHSTSPKSAMDASAKTV